MPEWHRGPVGPDKRHRKLTQVPEDMRVIRDTPATAATPATTPPVSPKPETIIRMLQSMPTDRDTPSREATIERLVEYLPSNPPTLEDEASNRSASLEEPLPDPSLRELRTLREVQVLLEEALRAVDTAVVAVLRSSMPGAPN